MPAIPTDFLFVLSIIITVISHRMRAANLSAGRNTAIAAVAIVVIAVLTTWIAFGFTSDIKADILAFCSVIVSMFAGMKELYDLLGYQQVLPSPLAPPPTPTMSRATAGDWRRDLSK